MSDTAGVVASVPSDEAVKRPRDTTADGASITDAPPTAQPRHEGRRSDAGVHASSATDVAVTDEQVASPIAEREAVEAGEYGGGDDGDDEEGEDDDSEELLLREAELRSSQAQNAEQHNFAVRVAQRETRTLQRYIQLQAEWLKAHEADRARLRDEAASLATARTTWNDLARLAALWHANVAEKAAARAGWEHHRLQLLLEAQTRSIVALSRPEKGVDKEDNRASCNNATRTQSMPLPASEATDAAMQAAHDADHWRDALRVVEADANIGRLVESVAPLVLQPARQVALRGVAAQLRQLAAHSKTLIARCQALSVTNPVLERSGRQATLDGALQAMQQQLHCLARCLDPRERDVLERHVSLDRHVARLRLALRLLSRGHSSPSADDIARATDAYVEAQKEEQMLEAQYRALVTEVIFLRKWGMVSAQDGGLAALDLTSPAQVHIAEAESGDATRRLSEALLRCCNETLVGLVRAALYDDEATTPRTESVRPINLDESVDGTSGDPHDVTNEASEVGVEAVMTPTHLLDTAPFLHLLSLREATEWRHSSLAALLAANARLGQRLHDGALLVEAASEAQCRKEEALFAAASSATALDALQESVLSQYRHRLERLAAYGTRFLSEWQTRCIQPVHELCASVAFLLRLWHLAQQDELWRVHGSTGDWTVNDGTASLMSLLHELDTYLNECGATNAEAGDAVNAAATLSLPALPNSAEAIKRPFAELARRTRDALADERSAAHDDDAATTEALCIAEWCAEIPLEQLPSSLQAAQRAHDELVRAADESEAAAAARTQRIRALRAQLTELQANNNTTSARLNEQKEILARLVAHKAAGRSTGQDDAAKVAATGAVPGVTRLPDTPNVGPGVFATAAEGSTETVPADLACATSQEPTRAEDEHAKNGETEATPVLTRAACVAGKDDVAVMPALSAALCVEANVQDTGSPIETRQTTMDDAKGAVAVVSPSATAEVTVQGQDDPFRAGFGFDDDDDENSR